MNAPRRRRQYLREYEVLKKKGKPFFPYAVLKDSAMALIVVVVIIAMSIILGAEQGPKADPTTTTYVPRPEWYFFFLFEVLRVIKPPELVPIATIGIPTICMVLLLLLPFYDRSPERRPERRPIATTAGILTIVAMAYLTFLGADRRLADRDRDGGRAAVRGRQGGRGPVRLPRLPQDRRERQRRPGSRPDPDRRPAAARRDRALARDRAGDHALLRRPAAEKKFDELVDFLASLDDAEPRIGVDLGASSAARSNAPERTLAASARRSEPSSPTEVQRHVRPDRRASTTC